MDINSDLRTLDDLQRKESELGATYLLKIAELLRKAERLKERALAVEEELRRLDRSV